MFPIPFQCGLDQLRLGRKGQSYMCDMMMVVDDSLPLHVLASEYS